MSAAGGKVALVNTTTPLGCNGGSTPCSPAAQATIVDLIGYDGANFFEGASAAPTLSNTTAAFRDSGGCTDTDNNGSDFIASAPSPHNSSSPLHICNADAAPNVSSTTPANGATNIAVDANITINFSEPVDLAGGWFSISCANSGAHTATTSGGSTSFTLDPSADFANGETCTVTILASGVSDQDTIDPPDNMDANYVFNFTIAVALPCSELDTPIGEVQGSGSASPVSGQTVTVQGVVVGDHEGSSSLRGFYLQDDGDDDVATSNGIFVFESDSANRVSVGQVVQVTGGVSEFQNQTQISSTSGIQSCGATGSILPMDLALPLPSADYLERYEGMLVRFPQTLYVTEHFQLGRFGQVVMSSGDRLYQPTQLVNPGATALALQAANNLNKIIVDDALQTQNPDPIQFGRGGDPLSASNTLRVGDTATAMVGVMTYTWAGNAASGNAYRLRPINALGGGVPNFLPANPRPSTPPIVGGRLKVVSANLLNYFNTFTGCLTGVGTPPSNNNCRGAENQAEFDRQWPKTVAALTKLNADVIGVIEVENDGYGSNSAIQHLVDKLNDETAPGTYAFIDVDAATGQLNALGTDAIKVGLVYKPGSVTPVGQTAALNTTAFVNGGDSAPRSRPALAQAFEENGTGARFVVTVNHLKSKGSACDAPDAGDGQGNCNVVRTNAANELTAWLASNPTGTGDGDILIIGDLNAYAKEDPVTAIRNAGYTNLIAAHNGDHAYSFVFDAQSGYLDHALASPSLVSQVSGVADYHINADEPPVLDYNTNFKSQGQIDSLYAPDEYRVADHDPVVVGLNLNAPPSVDAGGPYNVNEGGSIVVSATGSDPDGDTLTYAWDLDDDGTFETSGQGATFSAAALSAPGSHTIKVRVSDSSGHTATDEAIVNVIYNFAGFFQPIANPPVFNTVKAGSSVPVKFSLSGDKGLNIFATGYPISLSMACDPSSPIEEVDQTITTSNSDLTYDPATNQYTYVWKTNKAWGGTCRQLVVKLNDGTEHFANFKFTN